MIKFFKNNKNKFISIFLVLCVVFSVSSSLFAATALTEEDISLISLIPKPTSYSYTVIQDKINSLFSNTSADYDALNGLTMDDVNVLYGRYDAYDFAVVTEKDDVPIIISRYRDSYNNISNNIVFAHDLVDTTGKVMYFVSTETIRAMGTMDRPSFGVIYMTDLSKLSIYTDSTIDIYWSSVCRSYTGGLSSESDLNLLYSLNDATEQKILYEIAYSDDKKKATLRAYIKNQKEGDTLYYSTLGFGLNGKLLNAIKIDSSAATVIDISRNDLIHVQALDVNGNIIDTVGINVNELSSFNYKNFVVDISHGYFKDGEFMNFTEFFTDNVNSVTCITPSLVGDSTWYYDIDFTITDFDDEFFIVSCASGFNKQTGQYTSVSNNELIKLQRISSLTSCNLVFRIVNKETGEIVHVRKVPVYFSTSGTVTGKPTGYDTMDDYTNNENGYDTGDAVTVDNVPSSEFNASDISTWTLSDYYDMVSSKNDVWTFFKTIMFGLPGWITLPISILIFGVVVITIYRFIRGA